MRMVYKFIIFSLLVLVLNSQAHALPSNLHNLLLSQDYVAVPLRQADHGNTLLIEASFSRGFDQIFILDTGAVLTTIDSKLIKRKGINLQKDRTLETGGMDSHRHRSYQVIIPNLNFSNLNIKDTVAFTEDESFIQVDNQPIAGKIGLDFLRHHYAIIDIPNQILYLKPTRSQVTKIDTQLKTTYQVIPLKRAPSRHQAIIVRINDAKPVHFLLDCGMPLTALSLNYVKTLGLPLNDESVQGQGSGGGSLKIYATYVKKFYVASLPWPVHELAAMDFKYVQVGLALSGVVGLDWLQDNQAIMDIANDVIYVKN